MATSIVAVLGQKGGPGKTTVALGLAVEAARRGVRVAILDLDPQASAASWRDRRTTEDVHVDACPPARLTARLTALRREGFALVILDTAGLLATSGIDAARVADIVLVPTRPAILDAETLPGVRDLLQLAGCRRSLVVINGMHPSATTGAEEARSVIAAASGLEVAPVHLCQRAIYAEAPASGAMPQDIEPAGRAAQELAALYDAVCRHAGMLQ